MSTQRLLRRIEVAEQTVKVLSLFARHCTCFPEDEQPEFRWRAEAEMAAEVLCPIHGIRFRIVVTRFLYRASWRYLQDFSQDWPGRSEQYRKAMRASFNAALWPPEHDGLSFDKGDMLLLRDGTKLAGGGPALGYSPMESRVHGNTGLP
jgi:alkylation response protein AidB-like acyl-CoA dehydrogenase